MDNRIQFGIFIDYDKEYGNPIRIFRTLSSVLSAFEEIDKTLLGSIDTSIETKILLENIESGSVRSFFANVVKLVPDCAIRDLDIKKIIGEYLVRGKWKLIEFLENKEKIDNVKQIENLKEEILVLAKETDVLEIPTYSPPTLSQITRNLKLINDSTSELIETDIIEYNTMDKEIKFNKNFSINNDDISELITDKKFDSTNHMFLRVKKPDYLGDSQWVFKHGTTPVNASIEHKEWLQKFQNRQIDVRPGDSLECMVKITFYYDHNKELINKKHDVIEVIDVHPNINIVHRIEFKEE